MRTLRLLLAGLLVLAFSACEGDAAGPEAGVTLDDLQQLEDELAELEERVGIIERDVVLDEADAVGDIGDQGPIDLLGRTVSVSGEVNEVISDTAFTIGATDPFQFEDPILVLADPRPYLEEGFLVQVTGEVFQFDVVTAETEFGLEVQDEDFAEFEGEVAIAAAEILRLEEDED